MKHEQTIMPARNSKGRTSRLTLILLFYFFILHPSRFILSHAATLRTFDGKTYEGEVRLEQGGQISVMISSKTKLQKFKITEVLEATFGPAAPKTTRPRDNSKPPAITPVTLKEGLTFRSGIILTGAQIEKADDGTLTYNKSGRRQTVSLVNVARIVFREIGPDLIAKIPENRTGVLLHEGDFVEGEFRGYSRGRIQLSSVLFGLSNFDIRDKAVALILRDIEPARAQMLIRTQDGSLYPARSVTPDQDLLIIEDALGTKFSINRTEVAELSAGQSRMESLADLKPVKVEPAPKDAPAALTINATGIGLPMNLAGTLCSKGVTLAAGASATWNLDGKYRTLTFKCGVPQGALPTAPVRFIITADGKELYKSRTRTSLDQPLSASVSIKDAKTLTLKVESAAGDLITTPGLWGDVGLVK
jgi:hypothetical protein